MDKRDIEEMERMFEEKVANMERRIEEKFANRFEAEYKKLIAIVTNLSEKLNTEQIEKQSAGDGIGFQMEKLVGGVSDENVNKSLEEIASAELIKAKQEIYKKDKEEIASAELIKAKQEIYEKDKELKELKNLDMKRRETISELLISTSKAEREETRLKLRQDSLRLGGIVLIRAGTVLSEVWKDGPVFSDLDAEQKKLQEESEATEHQLRNVLQKKLQKEREATEHQSRKIRLSDKGDGLSEEKDKYDGIELELEVYRCRLDKIKQEQEAVLEQRARFELEKIRLIREMKRIRDEDGSRFNDFQILKDRYALLNLLGKGGYSEVYKAFDLVEHRYVACKLHGVNDQWSEERKNNYWKHIMRECKIQKALVHCHIVRLWDSFQIDKTVCTVLQYCAGKDLDAVLKATPILSESEARVILVQIFKALVYLNSGKQKIIHFDLKPGNVLFDELGVAKVTDFGLSKIVENDVGSQGIELTSPGAGTYWYIPPECFKYNKISFISSKVDVWSAGVLFYEMLFGKRPFGHGQTQESILLEETILKAHMVEFPSMPTVSDEAKEFIRRCLTYNQAERPDVLTVAQDPYLIMKKS